MAEPESTPTPVSTVQSVQTFGRKVRRINTHIMHHPASQELTSLIFVLIPLNTLQKTAVAVAHVKRGSGLVKLNGALPDRGRTFVQ